MLTQAAVAGDLMSVSKELKGEFHHLENGVRGLKRYNNLEATPSLRGVNAVSDEAIPLGCVITQPRHCEGAKRNSSLRGSVATEAISFNVL